MEILISLISVIVGAVIGFFGIFFMELKKRSWAKKNQKEKNKNILNGLEKEIEEGIKRCEGLIKFLENNKLSFSRIYTAFWDSAKFELLQNLEDIEILLPLHRIYYRFDLVNFNMEQRRLGAGAAFAKEYIDDIKENFNKFVNKIKNQKID